jgi:hypothetical protein
MSIVLFYVLFVCKCVQYYCHRVSTQLQLNISYYSTVAIGTRRDNTASFVVEIADFSVATVDRPISCTSSVNEYFIDQLNTMNGQEFIIQSSLSPRTMLGTGLVFLNGQGRRHSCTGKLHLMNFNTSGKCGVSVS